MDSFIKDAIKDKLTSAVKDKIAGNIGVGREDADSSIDSTLDAILGGLAQNTKDKSRAEDLNEALGKDHDGSIMDKISEALDGKDIPAEGGKILEHVFGSKKGQIADEVSKQTKLDSKKAGGLMDMLAPIVMGQLGKAKKDKGLDAGGLSDVLSSQTKDGGGLMSMVMGFLDKDKDGSVLDDITDMFTKKK